MSNAAILRAMISMARADKDFDAGERAEICTIYRDVTGDTVAPEAVDAEVAAREAGEYETLPYLRSAASSLDRDAQERLIKAVYRVLLCDGVIAAGERKKLGEIAEAVGMHELHYKAVLEDISA